MISKVASSALAVLLDQSIEEIATICADARRFDRMAICAISDVWDNNTMPLFRVAVTRPGWLRERRARTALAWMADLGPSRHRLMTELAAAAKHPLAALLPPPAPELTPYRDYRGVVMPTVGPVTAEVAASLSEDYELGRGELRSLRIERAGTPLTGALTVAVPRRYATPREPGEPALLRLALTDVHTVDFDSVDASGIRLEVDGGRVTAHIGAAGSVRGTGATVHVDDPDWEHSAAGRTADARTPREEAERPRARPVRAPRLTGATSASASVVHQMMLAVRMVRYADLADRVPLSALCTAFAGAGSAVFRAGAQPPWRRERAFRDLVEDWLGYDGLSEGVRAWLVDRLVGDVGIAGQPESGTAGWLRGLVGVDRVPGRVPAGWAARTNPDSSVRVAELPLLSYTAAATRHDRTWPASALVQLAVPTDGPAGGVKRWRLSRHQVEPVARIRVTGAAFAGPHEVHVDEAGSVRMDRDRLVVTGV